MVYSHLKVMALEIITSLPVLLVFSFESVYDIVWGTTVGKTAVAGKGYRGGKSESGSEGSRFCVNKNNQSTIRCTLVIFVQ